MWNLILDSSTKKMYCALLKDNDVVFEKYITGMHDHAKNIDMVVKEALDSQNIKALELDGVYCGIGPGSYTGVRMAVTVCKMLTSLSGIPLYSVSTLLLMSSGTSKKAYVSIDARRGNVFGAIYENGKALVCDGHYEASKFEGMDYSEAITEDNFVVDPKVVIANATKVDNPYLLVPNYLRDTEAERNLK